MPALRKYPPEMRERAVRLVLDARNESGGRRGVCTRVGEQLGIPSDTLRGWVQRAEVDQGLRAGTSSDDAARLLQLEREKYRLSLIQSQLETRQSALQTGRHIPARTLTERKRLRSVSKCESCRQRWVWSPPASAFR